MESRRFRLKKTGLKIAHYLKVVLFIPFCLFGVLVCFSLLLGWNVITLFLFWFVITPVLSIYLSSRITSGRNTIGQALIGLICFYGIMIFMIYEHFQSDYFLVMTASFLYNMMVLMVAMVVDRDDKRSLNDSSIKSI